MNNCIRCNELQIKHEIKSPGALRKALKVIQDNLADGTIVKSDYWPEWTVKTLSVSFDELAETEQWGDILEYYFECSSCHLLFRLFVETYHGQGGCWQPVS